MANTPAGFALLLLAALCGGLYTTPMGVVKTGWSFEATWFLYSLTACFILPWIVALATIPELFSIYGAVAPGKLFLTAVFGFLWGIGCQLFGIGISMVGNSLGFALILGLAATLGSVIPLVVLHPDEVATKAGFWNFAGLGLAVIALCVTAVAGIRKERDVAAASSRLITLESNGAEVEAGTGKAGEENAPSKASFTTGIIVCVVSGLFSACLNLANSFGSDISDMAVSKGAAKSMGTNAIYGISIAAGGLPNLAFCGYTMLKKGECPCSLGGVAWIKSIATTFLMALLWFGSNVAYGVATTMLAGDLGTVVGWPIYIIGMVIVANVSGVVTGEWQAAGREAKTWMGVGLFILCLAIVAVGLAG